MTLIFNPTNLLATLLVAGYASIFHLWTGRSIRDLPLYLLAAAVGFGLGQWVGQALQWDVLKVGQICTLEATLASALALIVVRLFQP